MSSGPVFILCLIPYHEAVLVGEGVVIVHRFAAPSGVLNYIAICSSCLLGFYSYVQCLVILFLILGLC